MYDDLTDDELAEKITYLREKVETLAMGGVATVVAGEGRRVEYSRANGSGIEALLKAAVRERDRRRGVQIDGAIGVTFPYGGDFHG